MSLGREPVAVERFAKSCIFEHSTYRIAEKSDNVLYCNDMQAEIQAEYVLPGCRRACSEFPGSSALPPQVVVELPCQTWGFQKTFRLLYDL